MSLPHAHERVTNGSEWEETERLEVGTQEVGVMCKKKFERGPCVRDRILKFVAGGAAERMFDELIDSELFVTTQKMDLSGV